MLWQVRALLPDRPGAMAALASRCGARGANILSLDVHPTADGQVVDQLVLHTPDAWTVDDVQALCAEAGVTGSVVTECAAEALEDQPVRYLRAARAAAEQPELLEGLLCRLLGATPATSAETAGLLMDDASGPLVALDRVQPFTATEHARVAELRLVAAGASASLPEPALSRAATGRTGLLTLRRGSAGDVRALVDMHDRCSADSLSRRYLSPVGRLSARRARSMLVPADGLSVVLTSEDEQVVGFGMVTFSPGAVEGALLVEDRWQGQGHGTRLLAALVSEAAEAGASDLTLLTRHDNAAVLATVHRAGLRAHVSHQDGLTSLRVPLPTAARRRSGGPTRARNTGALVALLHERQELREVYAPADLIDRAVRDGA